MTGDIHNPLALKRWHGPQRRIGITGGIASGKSSVGKFLKTIKGLPVLDADIYAHEALGPGQTSTSIVLQRYGDEVKNQIEGSEPSINRSALSKIIFANPNERLWLEQIIHPIVQKRLKQELEAQKDAPVIVLIIPLLFEARLNDLCSEVWVIACDANQQIQRLMERNQLSESQAKQRVQAQWPIKTKLKFADIIIDNSRKPREWLQEVDKLC